MTRTQVLQVSFGASLIRIRMMEDERNRTQHKARTHSFPVGGGAEQGRAIHPAVAPLGPKAGGKEDSTDRSFLVGSVWYVLGV
jgi:hypothetical protein